MKQKYWQYYKLKPEQLKRLFEDCLFVIDTNVLLDCTRMRPDLCEKQITLFEKYKERIKIPAHVAFEYHNHAWEESAKNFQTIHNYTRNFQDCFKFNSFISEKYKLYISREKYQELQNSFDDFRDLVTNELNVQFDYWKNENENQPLLEKIVDALKDCFLPDIEEGKLNQRREKAMQRIANKIPPGFKDNPKKENKEGDYLIWCEILDLAKTENKSIVFISEDLKDDWRAKCNGADIGMLPALRKEFYENAPDCEIYTYTISEFIKYADPKNEIFSKEDIEDLAMRRAIINKDDESQKGTKNEEIMEGNQKNKKKGEKKDENEVNEN